MIADHLSKTREVIKLGDYAKIEISERHDGKWRITLMRGSDRPLGGRPQRFRWREAYGVTTGGNVGAYLVAENMGTRYRSHCCLPCGSFLLNGEINEYDGICCHRCFAIYEANGNRWPA